MKKSFDVILNECIRQLEASGGDIEAALSRYREQADELRAHLEVWASLSAVEKEQATSQGTMRGQQQMLAAITDMERRGEKRMIPFLTPAAAKAAVVMAGVALLVGGAAGASAALGGPDVADQLLSSVGITSRHDGDHPDAAEDGVDTADRGADNSDGAPPAAEDGLSTADGGADNSDGALPAAEDGLSTTDEAADEAGDVPGDAVPDDVLPDQDRLPDDIPLDRDLLPDDIPLDQDAVPDDTPVPQPVPGGP